MTNAIEMQKHLEAALAQSHDEHAMDAMVRSLDEQIESLDRQKHLLVAQRSVWQRRADQLAIVRENENA
jgi:hypothetical protein